MGLACIARETSLFLAVGVIVVEAIHCRRLRKNILFPALLPVVVVAILTIVTPYPDVVVRNELWVFNFANYGRTVESLVSLPLALGAFLLLIWFTWQHWEQRDFKAVERAAIGAAMVVFLINTPIVYGFAKVRESRLVALPLVFLWPIAGRWLSGWVQWLRVHFTWRLVPPFLLLALTTKGVLNNVYFSNRYGFHRGYKWYLAVLAAIALTGVILRWKPSWFPTMNRKARVQDAKR